MRRALLLVMTAVIATASCSDGPTGSDDGPRMQIIAGAGTTDTISSKPTQGLVVEVRGESGKPEAGVEVRFESSPAGGMGVSGIGDIGWYYVRGATTDANGRATVRVTYGERAGPAWIAVSVPLYNWTDTARYTIQPGAAARVILAPKDTTIAAGTSFTYRGAVTDRSGNPRPDPATFEAVGTAVTVTNTGIATAAGFGNATVRARATVNGVTWVDSGTVLVVPVATIAVNTPFSELIVTPLTGESGPTLTTSGEAATWEPGGSRMVASNAGGLVLIAANGTSTSLPTPGFLNSTWPEWSADGFIYFQGQTSAGQRVARIRPDGSGLQTLTTGFVGAMPSPSPDGRSIVYVAGGTNGSLTILDLATSTRRVLTGTSSARAPRWSPDGQWIAYTPQPNGELMLIRPDGTGLHRIGEHGLHPGITWSADSKWILGAESFLTLVDVNTGVMTSLKMFSYGMRFPAWKR